MHTVSKRLAIPRRSPC